MCVVGISTRCITLIGLFWTRFPQYESFKFVKSTHFFGRLKKADSSDNTWRHHNPASPAPEVIRGRWTIPAPLQPLPTPSGPCIQVHPELHSSCSTPDESHVRPHSAPEQTGRASGAAPQLGNRSRDPTFACTLDLRRKGSNFSVEIKRQVWHLWRSIRGLNAQLWVLCCLLQPTALAVTFPKS